MKKKNKKVAQPLFLPRPIYVDVDDTLILYNTPSDYPGATVTIEECKLYDGGSVERTFAVNTVLIEMVCKHKSEGCSVIVWSAGGSSWALMVVKALGLEEVVDAVTAKPDTIYDDWKPADWMPEPRYPLPPGWYRNAIGVAYDPLLSTVKPQSFESDPDD